MTESTGGRCCPVVELRQYTLKPGRRDDLIEVFDRHLVEPQEALGMTVIGQFRDRQRPDRFVWLRGFADMEGRHRALEALYGGPSGRSTARRRTTRCSHGTTCSSCAPRGRRRRSPSTRADRPETRGR